MEGLRIELYPEWAVTGIEVNLIPDESIFTTNCQIMYWRCFTAAVSREDDKPLSENVRPISEPMLPKDCFKDKLVFITGGGTGLGKGMATMFSSLGAEVVISSRKEDVIQKTAEEITSVSGNKVYAIPIDLCDPGKIKAAADKVETLAGGLPNAIINNAADNFLSPSERLSPNTWRTVVDIVLNGTAYVTLEFGKRLIKANQGCNFLAITAVYSDFGSGFVTPSAAAKAGVENLTRSLASEWGRYGIRINAIAPGPRYTKGTYGSADPTESFFATFQNHIPLGRLGEAGEFCNLATYLVSEYSSWLTGAVIHLDGGLLPSMAGEFNFLRELTSDQWDEMEQTIRKTKES